jgi:holo-[acyl-carrier protein] synthase
MKPIPFPLALNIGTDIVHLPRITRLLQRTNYLTRFTRRILSDQEQLDFQTRFKDTLTLYPNRHASPSLPPSTPIITPDMTRWLAGRFAAKEAARKAAPGGAAALGWKDVVVRVPGDSEMDNATVLDMGNSLGGNGVLAAAQEGTSRRPEIVFLGGGEGRPDRLGQLSISHDGEYVVATVLAAG